ncbi:MAG TPA: molybdate ABC transporter permease subunit [Actinomycetota bacterium]|nr:molybdate ABC transporter permease subunit [Actinomycetota bacterium]
MTRPRSHRVPVAVTILGATGAAFFIVPFAGLVLRTPWSDMSERLLTSSVGTAVYLSILCSLSAMMLSIVLGFPLAWTLARGHWPGRSFVRALTTLPLVLPPVVGGVALLLALGPTGLIGGWLRETFGITFFGTTTAVIIAETFVAMPFFVLTVEAALHNLDPRFEEEALAMGASRWLIWRRVMWPSIAPAVGAGAVLSWARALGEFGATITFAGNFPGITQTLPLAVFVRIEDDRAGAIAVSLIAVALSISILVVLRDRWLRPARR